MGLNKNAISLDLTVTNDKVRFLDQKKCIK